MTTAREDHKSVVLAEVTGKSGRVYTVGNWTGVQFSRSIESVVGSCTLDCAFDPRVNWKSFIERPIKIYLSFDNVDGIRVHSIPLMTGYVRGLKIQKKAEGPQVTLTVKDKVIDLVECHPITVDPREFMEYNGLPDYAKYFDTTKLTPPQFEGLVGNTLANICRSLAAPFDIDTIMEGQWRGEFDAVTQIEETETVFNQIAKLCKQKAVVPHTDGYGRLILGQFAYYYRQPIPFSSNPYDVEYNLTVQEFYERQPDAFGNPGETWISLTDEDILEFEQNGDFSNRFSAYKVIYTDPSDAGDEVRRALET
jgi:prophage tail gpP-like protein